MKKKILVIFGVFIFLLSLSSCNYKDKIYRLMKYSITENGELVDNEVKYYLGHRYSLLERESLYNKKSREWIYDEFKLTLSVDDNEDFYVSYVIPAEEFLSSKYLCKWDHDAIKEYDIYYRKDRIFTFNLSDAVIKNNFKIVLSYVNRDEKEDYKNIYEYTFDSYSENGKIYIIKKHNRYIRIGLTSGDVYIKG